MGKVEIVERIEKDITMHFAENLKFGDRVNVNNVPCLFISFNKDIGEINFLPFGGTAPRQIALQNVSSALPLPGYVKSIRKKLGRSQESFGQLLKVSRGTVAQWELGKNTPSSKNMDKLDKLYIYITKKKV